MVVTSWISLRVASINVSMQWWLLVNIQFLLVCFLNLSSWKERFVFFLFLKNALSFIRLKKSSNCLFVVSLLIVFCVGTKFKFLFKSLKVSLQNLLVLRLITCSAGSDWNLFVFSSDFCNLIKLSWFVRWSLWRQSVWCILLGLHKTQRLGTCFLNLHVCWMF